MDDDHVASYFFAIQNAGVDIGPVNHSTALYFGEIDSNNDEGPINTPIKGRTGSRFRFRLRVTEEVERTNGSSNHLFTTFGRSDTSLSTNCHIIETNIRVTGMTTGYRVSIPIQIVKKSS